MYSKQVKHGHNASLCIESMLYIRFDLLNTKRLKQISTTPLIKYTGVRVYYKTTVVSAPVIRFSTQPQYDINDNKIKELPQTFIE